MEKGNRGKQSTSKPSHVPQQTTKVIIQAYRPSDANQPMLWSFETNVQQSDMINRVIRAVLNKG